MQVWFTLSIKNMSTYSMSYEISKFVEDEKG